MVDTEAQGTAEVTLLALLPTHHLGRTEEAGHNTTLVLDTRQTPLLASLTALRAWRLFPVQTEAP